MRAISLWQPWATACVIGAKENETRHWPTTYRGPLVIHAAKRMVLDEMIFYGSCWNWCAALRAAGWSMGKHTPELVACLPFGALVGTVELVDCRPVESFTLAELETWRYASMPERETNRWNERQMGNYEPGRFAWVFKEPRAFPEPIPYKGAQSFFNVPDSILPWVGRAVSREDGSEEKP